MKRRLITMVLLALLAVGTLYALDATSNAPNRVKNGFNRKFLPVQAVVVKQLEFERPVRELAGRHGDTMFLMTGEPGKVYVVKDDLTLLKVVRLADPKVPYMVPRFYTTVEYPYVYIFGGNAAAYVLGDLRTGTTKKVGIHAPGLFSNPIKVGDQVVMSIVDTSSVDARFALVDLGGNIVKWENGLSKGKHDAGFVHTGIVRYDQRSGMLVNLHFYDNGFEVFSPGLELVRRAHTIDTTFHNPTQVDVSPNGVAYKHPPVDVNNYSAVYGGKLYVSSKLLADNEDRAEFYDHTVVDKYDLASGKYEGSFYLPNIDDEPISQFYVLNEWSVLAFSASKVVKYRLSGAKKKT